MKKKILVLALPLAMVVLAVAGCSNGKESTSEQNAKNSQWEPQPAIEPGRGAFGAESCATGERIAVNSSALYAVYVDREGSPVDGTAEDLRGTHDNLMCPTPEAKDENPDNPQACQNGYCPRVVNGKQVCFRC